MGYQALLFCPDEKTARTVTQVLGELEFSVENCTEAFAAVKKLMAEHFDAVVVDCDNEQNATLLFKSARNSASNQTSLAVAVVEGQAGVAKAFRIGANLVLTKPINVEQAKGTLRVARGLLRKGDPAKPAAAAAPAPQPAPSKGPVAAEPGSHGTTPVIQRAVVSAPVPREVPPAAKPVHAASSAPLPAGRASDSHDIDSQHEVVIPAKAAPVRPAPSRSASPQSASITGGGAASAVAPARAASGPKTVPESASKPVHESETVAAQTLDLDVPTAGNSETPDAPSFTFGGANLPAETTSGGNKKAFLGIAAVALVGGGLYFGWTQFHAKSISPSSTEQPSIPITPAAIQNSQAVKSQTSSSALTPSSSPAASPSNTRTAAPSKPTTETADAAEVDDSPTISERGKAAGKNPAKNTSSASSAPSKLTSAEKPSAESKAAAAPIMVKKGAAASSSGKVGTVDAPDPSLLVMAAAGSGGDLPNLGASNAPKPVLQTLNVSQGVSQGLLIKKVQPIYPSTAMHMHVEGSVQLMATIGKNGSITAVKTLSGEPQLAKAALDAVKQWKYKPYYLNGDPVEIQTQITVNFKLPR